MRRRGRVFDLVAVLCLAVIIVVQVAARERVENAPAAVARDTFTHVDIVVDDAGLHVTPDSVASGQVEITVVDKRPTPSAALAVRADGGSLDLDVGTQVRALRNVRRYQLRAFVGACRIGATGAVMRVVVPMLAAPREAPHVVTVDVHDAGVSMPYREARLDQPSLAGTDRAVAESQPWTSVAAGDTSIVVRNATGQDLSCTLGSAGNGVVVDAHDNATLHAALETRTAPDSGVYAITCAGNAVTRTLGLLVTG